MDPRWKIQLLDVAVIGLILLALVGAAAPDYYRARDVRANRELVRRINTAQQAFAAAHPRVGYACSIDQLVETAALDPGFSAQTESYLYWTSCRGRRPHRSYTVVAQPKRGDRPWLCSDDSGAIASDPSFYADCLAALRSLRPAVPPSGPIDR